ncbi:hypothetical protein NF865_06620 [Thermococcus aggregans]|uniref:DUF8045 domain-containing protein n=1 Tax=Thermococcus aggregans TaxID=110163 RepID=A0A9E7SNQ1_THEAG|nr:hypothetical protein [Thermococcus aggregans]USS40017.1 hypothetical protein NF865_06620 [Thermococcus aggregans]
MHLRYYAPYYKKEKHLEIINLLEEIKQKHGIDYEEIPVGPWSPDWYPKKAEKSETYVYDYQLKPYSQVIMANCSKLIGRGLNLYCDTVSSKFKSRSGNVYVAGTIAVVENDAILLALRYENEIFEFLEALLREGWNLLNVLEKTKPKTFVPSKEREKEIKQMLVLALSRKFDYVLVDVKHNALSGDKWDPFIAFSPDADIIAINEEKKHIIGIEVKGYRTNKGAIQKAKAYEAIGEAMMYLINPYMEYREEKIEGSIFDKVWLCYPYKRDFEDFKKVMELTPIGLLSAYEGVVKEPEKNPFVNEKAKEVFLENLSTFRSYIRGGRKMII